MDSISSECKFSTVRITLFKEPIFFNVLTWGIDTIPNVSCTSMVEYHKNVVFQVSVDSQHSEHIPRSSSIRDFN